MYPMTVGKVPEPKSRPKPKDLNVIGWYHNDDGDAIFPVGTCIVRVSESGVRAMVRYYVPGLDGRLWDTAGEVCVSTYEEMCEQAGIMIDCARTYVSL